MTNDSICENRKTWWMAKRKKTPQGFGEWLQAEFDRTGKKQSALAELLKVDPAAVNRMLINKRQPKVYEMPVIRQFFGSPDMHEEARSGHAILEHDVRGGAGGGGNPIEVWSAGVDGETVVAEQVKGEWRLPSYYMRELGAKQGRVHIIEVLGDSMEPTLRSGDRVLIDMDHVAPSPPGVYAVWDGFGIVIKRIELADLKEPVMIRLLSDNPRHTSYERTLEEAKIIGRVICRISAV
jgi:hypothetical protein